MSFKPPISTIVSKHINELNIIDSPSATDSIIGKAYPSTIQSYYHGCAIQNTTALIGWHLQLSVLF